MDAVYKGSLYYESGQLKYVGFIKGGRPYGQGISYFEHGQKHREGCFEDLFIRLGKEYYENGNLRFEGSYNSGPKNYYGPRYFKKGMLYYETGELWYKGTFQIEKHGSMGYPIFKGNKSFQRGTEYDRQGNVIHVYRRHT
ncbi:hypothetical protein KM868_09750 [Micrococcus luteus]|nr:hypothetical protein [Micrococcus luteus]